MEIHRKKRKSFNVPGHAHELTFSCYRRRPLLSDGETRRLFLDALGRARKKWNFLVWAYVLMPEHAHVLVRPLDDAYDVANILKAIKQPVSQALVAAWRKSDPNKLGQLVSGCKDGAPVLTFWQAGRGCDRNLFTAKAIWNAIRYIHMNPVRRGLAESPADWPWSSARFYEGLDDVEFAVDRCEVWLD